MTNESAINRQATMSNAAYQIEKALAAQPQVAKDNRIRLIGSGSFGDLAVDFWGVVDRGEVDLWDVALAGTMVSLESVIDKTKGGQWDELQQEAQDIADGMRSPYPDADDYRAEDQRDASLLAEAEADLHQSYHLGMTLTARGERVPA